MTEKQPEAIDEIVSGAARAMRTDNLDEAIALSLSALAQDPDHAFANAIAFTSLFKNGKSEDARRMGGKAAKLNPKSEYILNNQACLQLDANQPAAASALLKSLINQYGEKPQWLYNLGLAQRMVGSYQNSIILFKRILDLNPAHDRAVFQLADLYRSIGLPDYATQQFNFLRVLRPGHQNTHAQYIRQAAITGQVTTTDLEQEFRLWGKNYIPHNQQYPNAYTADPKKLRLGIIVGTIRQTWWQNMVVPVLNKLCGQDDLIVYWHDQNNLPDDLPATIKVVDCSAMPDIEFARLVRHHKIDVIIDVFGMASGCRQRALGLQLAARQFGWLAHEGYYATDLVDLMEESLENVQYCFDDDNELDDTRVCSSEKTLFAINASDGLAASVVAVWAAILHELNDWVLHLAAHQPNVQNELKARFLENGINPQQISFDRNLWPHAGAIVLENLTHNDVFEAYTALRRGAIVVTLNGELFPAKQTSALIHQLDRKDWVADDTAQYQAKVVALANKTNLTGISDQQMRKAKLHNIDSFAKQFRKIISG